jgi:hypothetical protein
MNPQLAEALRLLAAGCEKLDGPLHIEVRHAGLRVILAVTTQDDEGVPAGPDLAAQIVAVLAASDSPLKGRAIAIRAGRQYTSYLRQKLADMREAGEIILTDEGYALPQAAGSSEGVRLMQPFRRAAAGKPCP